MNFIEFLTIKESPDETVDDGLLYYRADARAFLIEKDYILIARSATPTHQELIKFIKKHKDSPENKEQVLYIINGEPSRRLYNAVTNNRYREQVLEVMPNVIMGRVWTDKKIISFWNYPKYIIKNIPAIERTISLLGGIPSEYRYELDNNPSISYDEFMALMPRSKPATGDTLDNSWRSAIHIAPPEQKANILKHAGIAPKAPLDIRDKYRMNQGD